MSPFFSWFAGKPPEDTRVELCTALKSLGVDAQLAARGRVEEKIHFDPRQSLGVLDIAEGPIRWVNVTQETATWGGGDDPPFLDFVVYGVPAPRVGPGFPDSSRGCCGKVNTTTGVETSAWKLPIASARTGQYPAWTSPHLRKIGIPKHPQVTLCLPGWTARYAAWKFYPQHSCWMLQTPTLAPTMQEWDWYQAIAQHLLATPIPTGE